MTAADEEAAPATRTGDDEANFEPVERDKARGERVPVNDEQRGIPAGHLVVGALSGLILGGWALWEWLGLTGLLLAGGGVVAAGGGYGYLRHRRSFNSQARDLASALGLGRRHGSRSGRNLLDGSSGGRSGGGSVGRRMSFGGLTGGGRRGGSSRMPSLFGPSSGGGRTGGRHVPLSRAPGTTAAGRAARQSLGRLTGVPRGHGGRGAFRPVLGGGDRGIHAGSAGRRMASSARAAMHRGARRARAHGQAVNSEWTRAAQRLASGGGRRASRAVRAARGIDQAWTRAAHRLAYRTGRGVRRSGGRLARWADRRTGRITSGAWSALTNGDRHTWDAFRAGYSRWDAQMLFGLIAITEWATRGLRGRWAAWRKRNTPDPTATGETPNPAASTTAPRLIVPGARPLYRRNTVSGLVMPGGIVSPLVAISAEMVGSTARFLPPDMWWVAADLKQLDQVTGNVAAALRTYARNLDAGYPIDPRIVEMFDEWVSTVGKTSDYPMAIAQAFEQIHADDIKRRTQPRTNEHLWNV